MDQAQVMAIMQNLADAINNGARAAVANAPRPPPPAPPVGVGAAGQAGIRLKAFGSCTPEEWLLWKDHFRSCLLYTSPSPRDS